jgi:DNA-directed RNA polymerase alpha subunit
MTGTMAQTPLEALDLSVRSYNSLKRAGFDTIGDAENEA